MREIRLIKQIHPETATPWGLQISEGDRFDMLPGAYVTEKGARAARSDEQIRQLSEKISKIQLMGNFEMPTDKPFLFACAFMVFLILLLFFGPHA